MATLFRIAWLAMLTLLTGMDQLHAQPSSSSSQRPRTISSELERAIVNTPTRSIDLSILSTVPAEPQLPATETPVPTPDAAPAPDAAVSAATELSMAVHPQPTVVRELGPGRIAFVRLTPEQEREAQTVALAQVSAALPNTQAITLPGLIRVESTAGDELQLKRVAFVGEGLLQQPADATKFQGSILVGVVAVNRPDQSEVLSAPVTFQILESRLANPTTHQVTTTGVPYKSFQITATNIAASLPVNIVASGTSEPITLSVQLEPTVLLTLDRQQIQGYGLETAKVQVAVLGTNVAEGDTVSLSAVPGAWFENDSRVTLGADAKGVGTLRSDGSGKVQVTAQYGAISSLPATIYFQIPWRTVNAGLLGGLVGGLVRLLPKRTKRGSRVRFLSELVVAILCGLAGFALFAIGVNVFAIQPTVTVGSVVVATFGFLGGLFGVTIFDRIVKSSD